MGDRRRPELIPEDRQILAKVGHLTPERSPTVTKMKLPAVLGDIVKAVETAPEPAEDLPNRFGDVLAALTDHLVLSLDAVVRQGGKEPSIAFPTHVG